MPGRHLWLLCICACLSSCASCADWERPRAYFCAEPTYPGPGQEDPHCGPLWRCGLEQRCHAIGKEAPYACHSDADCEGAWRCGPEGRCLDVGTQALRPTGLPGPLAHLTEVTSTTR